MDELMKVALGEAKKAFKKGDVPVGAVVVYRGRIISKAYNRKERFGIATQHAEILAINKACKKLNSWHLENCVLFTTMEPCMMCCGAIEQARIKKVIYAIANKKYGCHKLLKNVEFVPNVMGLESEKLLKEFFKNKRS